MIQRVNCTASHVLLAAVLHLVAGCSFLRLERDLRVWESVGRLEGAIVEPSAAARATTSSGPYVVAVISHNGATPLVRNFWFAAQPGPFFFMLEPGQYSVAGFQDLNKDGRFDASEPYGELGAAQPFAVSRDHVQRTRPLILAAGTRPSAPMLAAINARRQGSSLENEKVSYGSRAALSDRQFSRETAQVGLWQPLTFITQNPSGIFLLGPYEEGKTPVLFVHGAGGTPLDFEKVIDGLDRTRFQPWVFYYPSGFPLSLCASFLGQTLSRTAAQYGVAKVHIVAHSMGGLVARRFILDDLGPSGAYLTSRFISVSSPWSGHEAAAWGVERAPVVIPSWHDMEPNSDYLRELFASKIADRVPYFLLFGFRGRGPSLFENNDGVVMLKSVLRHEAQEEARRVIGFDANHVGVLSDPEAVAAVNRLLESDERP